MRDELSDVFTRPLRLQVAALLRNVLHHGDDLLVALSLALPTKLDESQGSADLTLNLGEATASWSTELPGLLGAARHWPELLHALLVDPADLSRPLRALRVGGVAEALLLALLLHLSPALHHVLLHLVFLLLGPTLGLELRPADLGALDVAILHQALSTDLDRLIERQLKGRKAMRNSLHSVSSAHLLVVDEASFPEVLFALLLLLGLVVGDVGGVAPLVVAVLAPHLLGKDSFLD